MSKFKYEYSLGSRKMESARIRKKYPDRVPVICERNLTSSIAEIDKKKYLVPSNLTMAQFTMVIRKRIKLPPECAMFLFVNQHAPTNSIISSVYEEHKDEDGFLYVTYSGENVFGL